MKIILNDISIIWCVIFKLLIHDVYQVGREENYIIE